MCHYKWSAFGMSAFVFSVQQFVCVWTRISLSLFCVLRFWNLQICIYKFFSSFQPLLGHFFSTMLFSLLKLWWHKFWDILVLSHKLLDTRVRRRCSFFFQSVFPFLLDNFFWFIYKLTGFFLCHLHSAIELSVNILF